VSYEASKNKKQRHKDLKFFWKYHSLKGDKIKRKSGLDDTLELEPEVSYRSEGDGFQKMLKLREGIRRRNLKSASTSRQCVQAISIEDEDLRLSSRTYCDAKCSPMSTLARRSISRTSESSRLKKTFECRIEVVGNTNSIVVARKEGSRDLRTIHSSQKQKGYRKLLHIEGNKTAA
jgi:hypothetical protein